jgi:hypothetical protein
MAEVRGGSLSRLGGVVSTHYDFKFAQQHCSGCGWTGLGSETAMGDSFDEGAEYHCPTCGERFGFVPYPLLSESLTDPRAPETDRTFAEIAKRGAKKADDDTKP